MKIWSIFNWALISRTLVRLPVSNKILPSNKKLGGRCPGNSAPEQPRTLIFISNSQWKVYKIPLSFFDWSGFFVELLPKLLFRFLPIVSPPFIKKPFQLLQEAFPSRKIFIFEQILQERDDLPQLLFWQVSPGSHFKRKLQGLWGEGMRRQHGTWEVTAPSQFKEVKPANPHDVEDDDIVSQRDHPRHRFFIGACFIKSAVRTGLL